MLDRAIVCYSRLIQLDPGNAVAYMEISSAWITRGRKKEALTAEFKTPARPSQFFK